MEIGSFQSEDMIGKPEVYKGGYDEKNHVFIIFVTSFLWSDRVINPKSSVLENINDKPEKGGSTHGFLQSSKSWGTPYEAKAMVLKAIDYIKENGKEKAFSAFMDKKSDFFYKDLYLFVIDMKGNVLVHGEDKKLVGKNQLHLKDSTGKYFIKEFIDLMKIEDSAWAEYKWRNYETHEIESKLTFLKKIDDNLFIGCGAYYQK